MENRLFLISGWKVLRNCCSNTYKRPYSPVLTTRSLWSLALSPLGVCENSGKRQNSAVFCCTFVHFQSRLCASRGSLEARACHTLRSARVSRRDFLNRAEFLTWKLALNPICTGRHIFGQSCATADRENEPSILYNVASLLSYLPPANFKLSKILLP